MFAVRGRRGASDRALATRLTTTFAAAAAASLFAAFAPVAQADRIAQKRAEARAASAQIQAYFAKVEAAQQAYDGATQRLRDTNAAIADNQHRLAVARSNLRTAYHDLSGSLVAAYKDGTPDPLQEVLSAHSLGQMLDEIELVSRTNEFNATVVERVRLFKHEVIRRQAQLRSEKRERIRDVASQAARKAEADHLLANERSYYRGLKQSIRQLIAEQKAAEARLAAERAAAARTFVSQQATATASQVTVAGAVPGGSPTVVPVVSTPAPSGIAAAAASAALGEQGVPYVWGGSSPSGFDCSGLVVWSYAQAGLSGLPHYTGSLWNVGVHVDRSQLATGDLVFFYGGSHVGIYIGNGEFVHAPHTGTVVQVASLNSGWYNSAFYGAVRVTG